MPSRMKGGVAPKVRAERRSDFVQHSWFQGSGFVFVELRVMVEGLGFRGFGVWSLRVLGF